MRGIVIAAGLGSRMGDLTDEKPKCMLEIAGRTLLDWTIDHLRSAGCDEIVLITGYMEDAIDRRDVIRVSNKEFRDNNILHSLMYAQDYLDSAALITYSDIWVEPGIHRKLAESSDDIALAVDLDWQPYYEGRSDHPLQEAENVLAARDGTINRLGKHLFPEDALTGELCGEFLGLWRMSESGSRRLREAFQALNERLDPLAPFQKALEWRRAYITDIMQHMIDSGASVNACFVERGWAELDTRQDYERLPGIARRQRLFTFDNAIRLEGAEQ